MDRPRSPTDGWFVATGYTLESELVVSLMVGRD